MILRVLFSLSVLVLAAKAFNSKTIDCFNDQDMKIWSCEDNGFEIFSDYYFCNGFINFGHTPRIIRLENDNIAVAVGSKFFSVNEDTMVLKHRRKSVPLKEKLCDSRGRMYYLRNNRTYMTRNRNSDELENFMTKESRAKQLAYDINGYILFILSDDQNEENGVIYAAKTEQLEVLDDKVYATKIQRLKNVTSLAFGNAKNILFLGTKTNEGGRLLKFTRQSSNICKVAEDSLKAFKTSDEDIIEKTKLKREAVVQMAISKNIVMKTRSIKDGVMLETKKEETLSEHHVKEKKDELRNILLIENARLKRNLEINRLKFQVLFSKIQDFRYDFRSYPKYQANIQIQRCIKLIQNDDIVDSVCVQKYIYNQLTEHINSFTMQYLISDDNFSYYERLRQNFISDCETVLSQMS